jgi:hypothetical protein
LKFASSKRLKKLHAYNHDDERKDDTYEENRKANNGSPETRGGREIG